MYVYIIHQRNIPRAHIISINQLLARNASVLFQIVSTIFEHVITLWRLLEEAFALFTSPHILRRVERNSKCVVSLRGIRFERKSRCAAVLFISLYMLEWLSFFLYWYYYIMNVFSYPFPLDLTTILAWSKWGWGCGCGWIPSFVPRADIKGSAVPLGMMFMSLYFFNPRWY